MSADIEASDPATALGNIFPSLSALQAMHLQLLKRVDSIEVNTEAYDRRAATIIRREVRGFQKRAAATGVIIDKQDDRELVQSILDFWCIREAYLIRLAGQLRQESGALNGSARQKGLRESPVLPDPLKLQPFNENAAPELDDTLCPFVGLSAFGEQHGDRRIFYGREDAVKELVALVQTNRLVMVTGPSGSGKSSLVMAGLVPALRSGTIPGSELWKFWPAVQPGPDPLTALLQAVRPLQSDLEIWTATRKRELESRPGIFPEVVAAATAGDAPSLLIVDQAEELFSMTSDTSSQNIFISALVALTVTPNKFDRVILVVRQDFTDRLVELLASAGLSGAAELSYRPPPLTANELRAAIVGPAQSVGLSFEPGVVEDLIREVVNDPAALPLLQFTLSQLWKSRRKNKITRADFERVGSPNQALGRTAEQLYIRQAFDGQQTVRAIFMALVVPSVGEEYVRRRIRREALHMLRDSSKVDRVLASFVEAGLIRLTPGITLNDDRFEVMHEALLRNWPRLTEWLAEVRNVDQRFLFFLSVARRWAESGRTEDHLAVGAALMEVRPYAERDQAIAEFVEASDQADAKRQRHDRRSLVTARLAAALFFILTLTVGFTAYKLNDVTRQLKYSNDRSNQSAKYLAGVYCFTNKVPDVNRCARDIRSQADSVSDFAIKSKLSETPLPGKGYSAYLKNDSERK